MTLALLRVVDIHKLSFSRILSCDFSSILEIAMALIIFQNFSLIPKGVLKRKLLFV